MKLMGRITILVVAALVPTGGTAHALNITIPDLIGSGSGWYGAQEDQEVEPGCVTAQRWDLEGFFLDGTKLSMVGGYNFAAGQDGYTSGDLFFDVTGDVVYGVDNFRAQNSSGWYSSANVWGYDYAIDLNFTSRTYTVYAIDPGTLVTGFYRQNDASNPWAYAGGGSVVRGGSFTYETGLTDTQVGARFGALQGGAHNVVTLDLGGFLSPGSSFTSHFTMGCGNDNLMGRGTVSQVPEPGTLLLLGTGLLGLAGIRRRKRS